MPAYTPKPPCCAFPAMTDRWTGDVHSRWDETTQAEPHAPAMWQIIPPPAWLPFPKHHHYLQQPYLVFLCLDSNCSGMDSVGVRASFTRLGGSWPSFSSISLPGVQLGAHKAPPPTHLPNSGQGAAGRIPPPVSPVSGHATCSLASCIHFSSFSPYSLCCMDVFYLLIG